MSDFCKNIIYAYFPADYMRWPSKLLFLFREKQKEKDSY